MNQAVSVVMAVFNGSRYLWPQLESLLADLSPDDEVVIVNDASSDDSASLIDSLHDNRIRLFTNASNLGVMRSFEKGLLLCSNPVIFLCDQDDIWVAGKRDALLNCFERDHECILALSDAELIDSEGHLIAKSFMERRGGFKPGFIPTLVRNRYLGCTMAVHQRLLRVALPIPANAPMHDMWFGAIASFIGHVGYVSKPLTRYRRHDANVTPDTPQSLMQVIKWRVALLSAVGNRLLCGARGARHARGMKAGSERHDSH